MRSPTYARLATLPSVTIKREFGNETFLFAGTRFAALTGRALVTRLPPADLLAALRTGLAKPFVSAGAMARNGWVEIKLEGTDQATLDGLIDAAYAAVQHGRRRTVTKRPSAARRSRTKS